MQSLRRSSDRGHARHGWLDSHHTFSFADYLDPAFMGFGPLRVINEDRVAPSTGFGTHPHRDMEIISYVVDGELWHQDTLGNGSVIRPGEVQLMGAGTGIRHSEKNPRPDKPVHFLQIWILPAQQGTAPRYDQRDFGRDSGLVRVVSPDGRDGSLTVGQDVDIHRVLWTGAEQAELPVTRGSAWVQLVKGALDVNGTRLLPGDGLALVDEPRLRLSSGNGAEALVFDLPRA